MTERELRQNFADVACSYLGNAEADGSHRKIIDIYNGIKPLPQGYRLSYTDPWCAGYVSAMGAAAGLGEIILPECSCDRMIKLYKAKGRWQEDDAYVPAIGDIVMYDWGDSGAGDNTGSADHVGIVTSITGSLMKIIEGNISDKVGYRSLSVNARYIRGYCLPDFASLADGGKAPAAEVIPEPAAGTKPSYFYKVSLPLLKAGMKCGAVRTAQQLLIALGISCGPDGADGEFGPATRDAVIKFQQLAGLLDDGEVGGETWAKLLKG